MKSFSTVIFVLIYISAFTQDYNFDKISKRLETQLLAEDGYHHISILLSDRLDVLAMNDEFYKNEANPQERAFQLITALQSKASLAQVDLLNFLQQSNNVEQASIHAYWISNIIFIRAKKELIADLSRRDDIDWMDINARLEMDKVTESTAAFPEPDDTEPGLIAINAHKMWELGYTGYGQIAFVNDTGVDPTHPAFKLKYRGMHVPAEQTWFQYDSGNTTPFDCGDHGTHVLGTMIGLDRATNDTIGVAFNGQWIGAPILCGIGTEDNIAAFQWALDPDNDPSTFEDMPDVINNSWHDPSLSGSDCESLYVPILNALETSGIAVVFSAGNAGPEPMTMTSPHNVNTALVNTFTVGALDGNNMDYPIADFSSIGPSHCGGENSLLIKPEVSAPGVSVRSAGLEGTYNEKSGTSMAAPHVCGAIMLLKEAFPNLTGTTLKLALYNSCIDLGEVGEDNTYGMGIIDVFKAYNYLIDNGEQAVSPLVSTDVILYDADVEEFVCDGAVELVIKVENGGTDELTSFDVQYEVTGGEGHTGTIEWTGSLMTSEKMEIEIPGIENISAGSNNISIVITNPNGTADQRPLNNRFQRNLIAPEDLTFIAEVEQVDQSATCLGSTAILRADFEEEGIIEWYDEAEDGNLIGEGNILVLDELLNNTLVYAGVRIKDEIGYINPNPDEMDFEMEGQGALTFDSYYPFKLNSVKIFAETTGITFIQLRWSAGLGIVSKTVIISELGEQIIDLGFNVPVGNDLQLRLSNGVSLKHSTTGVNYPYEVEAVAQIKESNDETNPLDVYYYFYDWQIEYDRHCGRLPVEVDVEPSSSSINAAFETSNNNVDLDVNGEVQFTDNSTGAIAWAWDFGDGNVSDLANPSHVYSDTGVFYVSLVVVNDMGCSDAINDTLYVTGTIVDVTSPSILEEEINIFPIPTTDNLTIDFDLSEPVKLEIKLYDLLGREIHRIPARTYFEEKIQMSLDKFQNGIYFVTFENSNLRLVKKVVKG